MTTSAATDLDDFRTRCITFLDEHATGITVKEVDDPRGDGAHAEGVAFQRALTKAGLAGLSTDFPILKCIRTSSRIHQTPNGADTRLPCGVTPVRGDTG